EFDDFIGAGLVALIQRRPFAARPSSVAVDDCADMTRQPAVVELAAQPPLVQTVDDAAQGHDDNLTLWPNNRPMSEARIFRTGSRIRLKTSSRACAGGYTPSPRRWRLSRSWCCWC